MPRTAEPRPRTTRAAAAAMGLAAALSLAACASDAASSDHTPQSHTPSATASPTPRGVVTVSEANKILDNYQNVNNRANATRDARLLATVEAGQLYARSKAEFEQFETLSEKDQKDYGKPFTFTDRTFYLPAGGDWFAAQATTTGTNHTVMVFEKSPATNNTWKKVISLFPDKALPPVQSPGGVARTAPVKATVGALAPDGAAAAVEDLFATGGTKQGDVFPPTSDNVKSVLKTYKERGKNLGPQAKVSFFPTTPAHERVYTLRTRDGVLAIAPLAHNQESLVLQPGLQITPGEVGSVYDKSPRPLTVDVFQGEALVFLPEKGKPDILDYRYAQTDSR
ncbi:hypothetical protein [Streptomyces parvus]|uniref:hypothetical protein n=1 Tax=Streptomyces parvus TaxID=66428 RepID=UPI002100837A|nr:hypothetical protein [Streptomyces parvus]MCQ1580442.1 hypothetical protein [Streptomyces parvus]